MQLVWGRRLAVGLLVLATGLSPLHVGAVVGTGESTRGHTVQLRDVRGVRRAHGVHGARVEREGLPRATLRLCNAYAFGTAVHVFQAPRGLAAWTLTGDSPLAYKSCVDLEGVELQVGDTLQFSTTSLRRLGDFSVKRAPESSLLQVVIYRHDQFTPAADFASHAFTDTKSPQLAIVDAYQGRSNGPVGPSLLLAANMAGARRRQEVHFGTVARLLPGTYELSVPEGRGLSRRDALTWVLDAQEYQKYTVLRVGVEAHRGPDFPEELVVWPGGKVLRSAASVASAVTWPALLAAAAWSVGGGRRCS